MSVKSRSKTFKTGDPFSEALKFYENEMDGARIWNSLSFKYNECRFKKRVTITITYDRDDKQK